MRKIAIICSVIAFYSFMNFGEPISSKERKFAVDYLSSVEKDLEKKVKGLSEAQLKYKTSPETWSVEDCLKHIAVTEMGLWKMTDSVISSTATPDRRAEVKSTDQQVIDMVNDRSYKAKAAEPLQPQNTSFTSAEEALSSFKGNRAKLIEYVNTTNADLRDHIMKLPFGSFDSYQLILLIGAHTQRHTKQIEEVMANAGFPQK